MATAGTTDVRSADARRLRIAELTSGIGALVLGIGLGVFLPARADGLAPWLLAVGALAHGWGMYDKHRLERGALAEPWWSVALYRGCWVLLALGAIALSGRLLGVF